ncbi:dihydrofolate reductase [Salmonirosea aquatica]|uniref:Dihydrofolate reductase n=1 Tax=Salmonirosea aquatica TaxID=2654236 RepID=A0A7C9BEN5_9BACT|nr:dihydrofolate reductase [Cytophagaceae bacterium SJW1-29]
MLVSILVAVSNNGVIGRDNQLLWRLPDDLKRFKQLTQGHPIIMGRKTFESIGKPLPGRTSIVITRSPGYIAEGTYVVNSLEEALTVARQHHSEEAFIIGGGEIYRQVQEKKLADRLYITRVLADIEGDTFFEVLDEAKWQLVSEEFHDVDERHPIAFSFNNYSIRDVI